MYKVYLVEDESIVREGLRDNIPWEQYGFTFIGDSSDGELALPEILRVRPDVLITDIRMPFMDGLSLSRIVKSKLPQTRIIILSGYHDFDYARKAIEIGVERFLTKPVTRRAVTQVLAELALKLEEEKKSREELEKHQEEMQEYVQFRRRSFLERLFSGRLTVEEIYRESTQLGIDLSGPCYGLLLFRVFENTSRDRLAVSEAETELLRIREDILQFFLRHVQYLAVRWIGAAVCVIVKGEQETVERGISQAEEEIAAITASSGGRIGYLLCVSPVSDRLSGLKECYEKVERFSSCQYLDPTAKVITQEIYEELIREKASDSREDSPGGDGAGSLFGHVLERTLHYVDAHYMEDALSLQGAAKEADVSPGYLSGLFSQKMGMTFIEYVTAKRMDQAKLLLSETREHTATIAAMVGYKDPNYFRYVFKKTFGVTPREYRGKHLKSSEGAG